VVEVVVVVVTAELDPEPWEPCEPWPALPHEPWLPFPPQLPDEWPWRPSPWPAAPWNGDAVGAGEDGCGDRVGCEVACPELV
jgi:hypothetical protein